VPGDGGEAPLHGDHAQEEDPRLFRLSNTVNEVVS
jgi:hypothetical protein